MGAQKKKQESTNILYFEELREQRERSLALVLELDQLKAGYLLDENRSASTLARIRLLESILSTYSSLESIRESINELDETDLDIFSLDTLKPRVPKKIGASFYISNGSRSEAEEISKQFGRLLSALSYEIKEQGSLVKGSWYRTMSAVIKGSLGNKDAKRKLDQLDELIMGKMGASAFDTIYPHMAKLIDQLKDVDTAFFDGYNFIICKFKDAEGKSNIVAKVVTRRDRILVDQVLAQNASVIHKNPELLSKMLNATKIDTAMLSPPRLTEKSEIDRAVNN